MWRGRPLLNFSLEGTRPLRPPAFDAHANHVGPDRLITVTRLFSPRGCVCRPAPQQAGFTRHGLTAARVVQLLGCTVHWALSANLTVIQ